ncbi:type VI secretion system protein TssL, long form [Paraburkholderia lycopersici]|uniref:Type VI secretion system protein ImpK n=1 Tax=Paraburkholderia lycopersici TaxID=416944 RepID=A0A1G6XDE3_9BURK|nr:type VI secretion system protein TssL, long form [Paraburkholderia lycopersici]SDD76180.1 type VI secretion system protein ImpK [Paraburkholderia lycopersici]
MNDVPQEPGAEPRKLPPPVPKVDPTPGEPARSEPAFSVPPGEPDAEWLAKIRLDRNPLLEAARPLLRALADMPEKLDQLTGDLLRNVIATEVRAFQRLCEQASIRRDHTLAARYCLCTALDEVAMRALSNHGGQNNVGTWAGNALATIFHEDTKGGDKVYLLTGRLMQGSNEHRDLLEVIYRILSFGFLGRYAHGSDGHRRHEAVRQRIYNEVMAGREPVPAALSPNAKSTARPKRASFYDFPVWITVTLLSLVLLAMWGYYKYELVTRAGEIQKQIGDIVRMTPPPAPPVLHLKTLLENEIAAGTVSVDEDTHHSAVTFRGDAMFAPGGASVQPSMGPLIAKIAGEIAKVPGKVTVQGYTDNQPIHSNQFASNQALSEDRATQVMQMLQSDGVSASRLEVVGKGDADPVADNSTPQGRAQNRRVEILVTP